MYVCMYGEIEGKWQNVKNVKDSWIWVKCTWDFIIFETLVSLKLFQNNFLKCGTVLAVILIFNI